MAMIDPHLPFEEKIQLLLNFFSLRAHSQESVYTSLIELGRTLPSLPSHIIPTENDRVPGCQSTVYLMAEKIDDRIHLDATSDALISAGFAALLLYPYSGETPETILTIPPTYLQQLNLATLLTPSRANGLANMTFFLKKIAVPLLLV